MMRWIVALAVVVAAVPAGHALKGKTVREANDYPAAVLVEAADSKTRKGSRSSGCLLGPKLVLTAGHCIDDADTFRVTAPYAKGGPVSVKVKSATAHPKYKRGEFDHDVAVIVLEEAIEIEKDFPVLWEGEQFRIGTKFVVVGRVDDDKVSEDRLFRASTEVVQYPGNLNLYGGFPRTTQHGDSGGPVFVDAKSKKPIVVGIVTGMLGFSRRNVETDAYLPISAKVREWVLAEGK